VTIVRLRIPLIALALAVVVVAHWLTPMDATYLHAIHLSLRKLFFLPVILGAVWFGLRGSVTTAALATALYVPHILYQWTGQISENLNQLGELASIWIVALLSGVLITRERRTQRQVLESHQGALAALVAALDARERETERHSLRVTAFAEQLGREMGIGRADLEELRIAALLHDIGKIGVPDEILLGQARLNAESEKLVRRHPEIGYRILQSVPSLRAVAEVVYSHHERFDGNGYPRGLRGSAIPLHARILSVVDVFDALTTDRSYRTTLGSEKARSWIASRKGTQFDGDVVEAFQRVPVERWRSLRSTPAVSSPGLGSTAEWGLECE